ncbi:MAG: hypothetical protein EHM58_02380 [Ignavibacteriae bacterium]|nr:MAG: hypothetical protein EHM58_02380 [Ignavibacteriota bacterium]
MKKLYNEKPEDIVEKLYLSRILWLFDKGLNYVNSINKNYKKGFSKLDRIYLTTVQDDLTFKAIEIQMSASNEDIRNHLQNNFNKLQNEILKNSSETYFPEWVFKSELTLIKSNLEKIKQDYFSNLKNKLNEQVNYFNDLFANSEFKDIISLFRIIKFLIELQEFGHARQYLIKSFRISQNSILFNLALGFLLRSEHRFEEALHYYKLSEKMINDKFSWSSSPFVDQEISFCYYALGNLEEVINITDRAQLKWKKLPHFNNNHQFARTRKLLRDYGNKFWDNPERATDIFNNFLSSIFNVGSFGVAHFNYALLIYWAKEQNKTSIVRKALEESGTRKDLLLMSNMAEGAFSRARKSFKEEEDYFHMAISSYFIERSKITKLEDIRSKLLDSFIWDADNFISQKYAIDKWNYSLVKKDSAIKSAFIFNHLATLKRWKKDFMPSTGGIVFDGGGYFIKWNNKGLIINPGSGFINNFQRHGYAISEIDIIIVTNQHYSAYEELMDLIELIDYCYVHSDAKKIIEIYLERTVFMKFPNIHKRSIPSLFEPQILKTNHLLNIGDDIQIETRLMICENCQYDHQKLMFLDYTDFSSNLTVFILKRDNYIIKVGVLNEYCPNSMKKEKFLDLDILIVSLGDLIPYSLFKNNISSTFKTDIHQVVNDDKIYLKCLGLENISELDSNNNQSNSLLCLRKYRQKNGIDFEGLINLSEIVENENILVIVGDIPIELGDKRHSISEIFNQSTNFKPSFICEDVDLVVDLLSRKIICEYCGKKLKYNELDEQCLEGILKGPLKHICRNHRKEKDFHVFLTRQF